MLRKKLNNLASHLTNSILYLLCFLFIFTPKKISASELVGTHLGDGDIGTQINSIRTVLIPNGLEPGSPVTVMVGVNMLQDSQINTVVDLANTVKDARYYPIVRINDVCNPLEGGLTPVSAVQKAKAVFGDNSLVVWGNEVNNKEKECSDWAKYMRDYASILDAGIANVSPAALDYYMGRADYSVEEMLKTPNAIRVFNSSPRAANAYGCVGSKEPSCNSPDWGGNTEARGYESAKSKGTFYLTEFSLSPEGRAVDAPDTSISKVIQFINEKASQTGASKITPLLRNVCNEESEWLLYINGKVFTNAGTDVTDNCSGKSGAGGYDLSKYKSYGIDPNLFFLTPLRYTDKDHENIGSDPKKQLDYLRRELVNSGYEAYCASENIKIKAEFSPEDLVNKFLRQYPTGVNFQTDSVLSISTKNAQYPLWRDTSDKQFLTSSLEEYFGFKDVHVKDPSSAEITSAPINSLMSQKQMCVQGWRNLVAQQLACERLEDPSKCSLLGRPIPDTRFTVNTLLDEIAEFEPAYRDGGELKGCDRIFSTEFEKNRDVILMKEGLINTPTYIDTAYRYGFIVAAVETTPPNKNGNFATRIFNFFTGKTEDNSPKHEVLISAFKLPDIGTNKGGGDDSGHQFFNDPLDLTRKVVSTAKQNDVHENVLRSEKRRDNLTAATNVTVQNKDNRIFCYDGTFGTANGTGTTTCEIPLSKALTDIINGYAKGCGETENVTSITNSAGLGDITDDNGKVFNDDNGRNVLKNLFLGDDTHMTTGDYDPQIAETDEPADKLESIFTVNDKTWSGKNLETNVNYYIVYPMGYEIEQVEKAIQGTFFTKQQIADMDNDPKSNKGLEFKGISMSLQGGSGGWNFEDKEQTDTGEDKKECIDPETGELIFCTKDITVDIEQDGQPSAGIFGGKLGFIMKKVQTALNTKTSDAFAYFNSCKTTEELLLGKCRGGKNTGSGEILDPDEIVAVAMCQEGSLRMTTGEKAEHVEIQNPVGACVGKKTTIFDENIHDIPDWKNPNDPVIDCADLYSYAACVYPKTLVQNSVNSEGQFTSNSPQTACEYVVNFAKNAGISPRFALAMWGEESGFSNYRVADLGVISQPAQDLGAQMDFFSRTVNSYSNYLDFLLAYSGEERTENQFCNNRFFPARLKSYYDHLAPF